MRGALVLLTAVGLLTTACSSGTEGTPVAAGKEARTDKTSTSRAPFDGERLGDGEVVKVNKLDGIRLESPDDGALRSWGVTVDVVDFGTADVIDGGNGVDYGAGEDSTLLAFRLSILPYLDDVTENVSATVSVDGRQRSLPEFSLGEAGEDQTLQYVVAVPKDRREVELELKYAGFAQQFDLLEGRRTGEQPDILYRSEDAPTVYVENLTPSKLPVTNENSTPGNYIVGVTRAELTYFAPELGDMPSAKDKAWLVVDYKPTGDGSLESSPDASGCVVPFAGFTVSDGKGTYPVVDKQSSMEEFDSDQRLVFEVPADLTKATLRIAPQGFSCAFAGDDYPYTVTTEATVEMTLPQD